MNAQDKNTTLTTMLLERMEKQRLPRLIDIRDKLKDKQVLDRYDLEYLTEVLEDTQENEHILEQAGDDLKNIFIKVISLYTEITQQAMSNEALKTR